MLQCQNSFEFPAILLSSPMQAGTAAIPSLPMESFSTETQTPDPYPKSKGNGSTNAFSQGLTENLGQSKKFHLNFLRYKTAPKMGLAAHRDLPYCPYNARVRPQSPEPKASLLSNKLFCPLVTAASTVWRSQQDIDIVLLRPLRQQKTCVDPDILP